MSDPQAALNASQVADIPIVTIVRVMNALKAAGYAVVELPKPETFADDYAVVGNEIRHYAPNGFGAYWRFDFDEADTLARSLLSLLAAADAAEVTEPEPDPHAGQLWANELQQRQRQVPSDREWS